MNLHEYQSKDILAAHNVNVPIGYTADTPEEAKQVSEKLQKETGSTSKKLATAIAEVERQLKIWMGNRKLAKNTLLYTIGTLLPQVAAFILLPIYTRFLSPSDYGVLNSVQVISSVLAIIYTLSIDKAIYRLYFDFKTEKSKKDYLGTIFITVTLSVALITSLLFIFPGILGAVYKDITFYPYISLSVIASSLATFVIIPRSVYFVKEKANKFILISLAEFFYNRNTHDWLW